MASAIVFRVLLLLVLTGSIGSLSNHLNTQNHYGTLNTSDKLLERIDIDLYPKQIPSIMPRTSQNNDKMILENLYHSTAGSYWTIASGWLKGDPCDDKWYGIKCSLDGRVTEINLSNNSLTGQLPNQLDALDTLEALRLYDNFIGGQLLLEIFDIKTIKVLDLDSNNLGGNLPPTLNSPLLNNLSISHNKLTGFLPVQWNTPLLEYVQLSNNMFVGPLPPGLSKVSKLRELDLSFNFFSGSLPSEYGNLKALQKLILIGTTHNGSVPQEWSGMSSLTTVHISSVQGSFPSWIGTSWTQVEGLILYNGGLSGPLPNSLCKLQKLNKLQLSNNVLSGQIPDCICELSGTQFTYLDLSYNKLSGQIPDCLSSLTNLTSISLQSNELTGQLPPSLGDLKKLELFQADDNLIHGTIPATYNKLAKAGTLNEFSLYFNSLSSIDSELETFMKYISTRPHRCFLFGNPFSCPLPTFFNSTCGASCSQCNSGRKHMSCESCVGDSKCGWCTEGPNCIEGTAHEPTFSWSCAKSDWKYGLSNCPKSTK